MLSALSCTNWVNFKAPGFQFFSWFSRGAFPSFSTIRYNQNNLREKKKKDYRFRISVVQIGSRSDWVRASLGPGQIRLGPDWVQVRLGPGQIRCRWDWVQLRLDPGQIGSGPDWVQFRLGAGQTGSWPDWVLVMLGPGQTARCNNDNFY